MQTFSTLLVNKIGITNHHAFSTFIVAVMLALCELFIVYTIYH